MRGLEGLIQNGGHMRLLVGCTLNGPEVTAINQGEELRKAVETGLLAQALEPPDRARRARVLDIPTAVRDHLLRFLPPDGELPARLRETPPPEYHKTPPTPDPQPDPTPDIDPRRLVWGFIRHAPALPDGSERVGEATATVTPWPHQVRAFQRLYQHWPPRLLIADEVGLGKTIQAGLLLRQAWLAGHARRILVMAPKAVLRQWQLELREKFNLNWPTYDGQMLRWYPSRCLAGQHERAATPETWHQEPAISPLRRGRAGGRNPAGRWQEAPRPQSPQGPAR